MCDFPKVVDGAELRCCVCVAPVVVCNHCGAVVPVQNKDGTPFPWFYSRGCAPGWTVRRFVDGTRFDYCEACSDDR